LLPRLRRRWRISLRTRDPRMTYNPSLGVVAAEAGDAVRLPRPNQAPTR
jgi:hypothetical protein